MLRLKAEYKLTQTNPAVYTPCPFLHYSTAILLEKLCKQPLDFVRLFLFLGLSTMVLLVLTGIMILLMASIGVIAIPSMLRSRLR